MKNRRVFRLAAVIFVCGAWLGGGTGSQVSAQDKAPGSAPPGPIKIENCTISAVKMAQLATDRPGVMALVGPKEGDSVRQGEIVAKLVDDVARANLEMAQAEAKGSEVEIEYSELLNAVDIAEYEKSISTNRAHANTVTDIEIRRLKLGADKSRLQIDKSKQDMSVKLLKAKQAEAELKTYWIVAPFDGVVTRVRRRYRGEAVHQGDTILEVVNTDVVRVEGDVSAKNIWSVKPGAPVSVRVNVDDADLPVEKQVLQGRISFVDVVANDANNATRVWAEVPNPGNVLRPGLRATMTINPLPVGGASVPQP